MSNDSENRIQEWLTDQYEVYQEEQRQAEEEAENEDKEVQEFEAGLGQMHRGSKRSRYQTTSPSSVHVEGAGGESSSSVLEYEALTAIFFPGDRWTVRYRDPSDNYVYQKHFYLTSLRDANWRYDPDDPMNVTLVLNYMDSLSLGGGFSDNMNILRSYNFHLRGADLNLPVEEKRQWKFDMEQYRTTRTNAGVRK